MCTALILNMSTKHTPSNAGECSEISKIHMGEDDSDRSSVDSDGPAASTAEEPDKHPDESAPGYMMFEYDV